MSEWVAQKKHTPWGKALFPFDAESAELLDDYCENQLVRVKTSAPRKPRSYQQIKAYFVACQKVADNKEGWLSKENVDFRLRVALDFRDTTKVAVRPDGQVQFYYRSIAYENLKHIEANNYFDRSFALMAEWLGIDKDELLRESGA